MNRHDWNRNFRPRDAVIRLLRPRRDDSPREQHARPGEITAAVNRAARRIAAAQAGAAAERNNAGCDDAPAATIAERLVTRCGTDWHAFVGERVATWAAGYFDEGPAGRRSPWWGQAPYAAWRGEAELDRTPELLGLRGFCAIARTLPRDADGLLQRAARDLRLPGHLLEAYCVRLLDTVPGLWCAARDHAHPGRRAEALAKELLAIRAAWDVTLLDAFRHCRPGIDAALRGALETLLERDTAAPELLLRRA